MKDWLRDTLFKRLFLLMWVALFVSHFAAFFIVNLWRPSGGPPSPLPVMPSLPPTPGIPQSDIKRHMGPPPGDRPAGAEAGPERYGSDRHGFERPGSERRGPDAGGPGRGPRPPSLPSGMLLLDYAVRFLLIGVAAWFGARWLSRPVARLVDASRALTRSLANSGDLPRLDEQHGTVEVREAAHVFNEMANQLSAQFRTRGLMMAALSHDLRTPLTRMRVRLETLEKEPAALRCIEDIREMNSLLTSALQLFRDADADEALALTDVFALVQSLTDDLAEQGRTVALEGTRAVALVRPLALRRVISNLLQNALHYGERVQVTVGSGADAIRITIDDDGPGIPDSELETVFQPFYRRDGSRSRDTGGAGLGLYIARDLIQRQSGTLSLANRREGGLRAIVQLPLPPPRPR